MSQQSFGESSPKKPFWKRNIVKVPGRYVLDVGYWYIMCMLSDCPKLISLIGASLSSYNEKVKVAISLDESAPA